MKKISKKKLKKFAYYEKCGIKKIEIEIKKN